MFYIKLIIIFSFVQIQKRNVEGAPILWAGAYTILVLFLGMFNSLPFAPLLLRTAVSFFLVFYYFKLLDKYYGAGIMWWVVLIAGFAIAFL